MKRYALITGARTRSEAEAYLPDNYSIIDEQAREAGLTAFVIEGEDVAGWTMEDYVIPRFASGLIWATEIGPDHPALKVVLKWVEDRRPRKYLDARFDVTGWSDEQISTLSGYVGAQAESNRKQGDDVTYPDAEVEFEVNEVQLD